MRYSLCLLALGALLAASIADAADGPLAVQSFDRTPQYTLYVQKRLGGKRRTPLEFGLSLQRGTRFGGEPDSVTLPAAAMLDLRIASSGGIRINGMKMRFNGALSYSGDSYDDEGYWSFGNPWVVIGIGLGILGGLCIAEALFCKKSESSSTPPTPATPTTPG